MKKISTFWGILIVLAVLAVRVDAQSFLTNGLVAYYPFKGNANDASGNGNNPTTVNASLCPDRFGNTNQAYFFDGSTSYIDYSSSPLNQVDNWTVSVWLMPASLNQQAWPVLLGYDDGVSIANGFAIVIAGSNAESNGNQLCAFYGGVAAHSSGYSFSSTNQWYHVVMLRSSGVTMFYVNGVQIQFTMSATPRLPTAFRIGAGDIASRFYCGAINDVRI